MTPAGTTPGPAGTTARTASTKGAPCCDAQSGRVLLLTIGLVAVALMIIAMVASATAVHLDEKHLYNLADRLASDAANTLGRDAFLAGGASLSLTDAQVSRAVSADLAGYTTPADLPENVHIAEAITTDGRTVRVRLTATSHPPLVTWFTHAFGTGFNLEASSSARVHTGAG
jgi:hypothetical protein